MLGANVAGARRRKPPPAASPQAAWRREVVYHEKDLIKYDFNYDLAAGSIVYHQVMPFQWYSFQDTPDIIKVADLVGLKPSSDEAGIGNRHF